MPKCIVNGCNKFTRYKQTKEIYCPMHKARIKRNGYLKLKYGSHGLEKLPHPVVDDFIRNNYQKMIDKEIVKELKKIGLKEATWWSVRYRRRKLGIKKYLYGEIKKHKAWVRIQAIKRYGNKCELCGYKLTCDAHHIVPKKEGGIYELNNLAVLCPNCHALISRSLLILKNREDIIFARERLRKLLLSI